MAENSATPVKQAASKRAAVKQLHVLYKLDDIGNLTDIVIFGDKIKALEDLATTHEGYKYTTAPYGASFADHLRATAGKA